MQPLQMIARSGALYSTNKIAIRQSRRYVLLGTQSPVLLIPQDAMFVAHLWWR